MKITALDHLHVDGGWTVMSYLKISTDSGLVGWAEYSGHQAIPGIVAMMAPRLIGVDPCNLNAIDAACYHMQRPAPGSLYQRALGAVLNACLDIKGKAWGVPVYDLLGGKLRDRVPLYWSHCGLFRASYPTLFDSMGSAGVRSLDDLRRAGEEAARSGVAALKTNPIRFDMDPTISSMMRGQPELNIDNAILAALRAQLQALAEGAGSGVQLMLDVNFNYKIEGFRKLAGAVAPFDLMWLELDLPHPESLRLIRDSCSVPIASLEMQLGRRNLIPFLEARSADVAIIDPQWNGVLEASRMASVADAYDVNCAAHCSAGPLGALMSAHFCAAIPNLRIQEHEFDVMPWHNSLLTRPNTVEHGHFVLTDGPGWGADVDEEVARAHPGQEGPSARRG